MVAEFGQQQWSGTNFRCSDRTLRSRDKIFEFSQEKAKIWAAAWILDIRGNFDRSCRYNQPVQYGRDAAHKSRAAWAFRSLEVYMSQNQHIYEDLNESSSASPGGSQLLEILPSPNSKTAPTFPLKFWLGAEIYLGVEISTSAIVLSYAWIFTRRINSVYPPKFSAWIFRRNFPPKFSALIYPQEFSA